MVTVWKAVELGHEQEVAANVEGDGDDGDEPKPRLVEAWEGARSS